ncbi:lysine/arginine/ornithine ABC transporter substrate-binding protein [Pseudosulfitobacter pseudonitzschiae]|uniref:lysine/arginine/ornithine ABC transporter substrate-binding protein n=1 Tax=Pseudosulfitobacter pseudonitzschiae TaxID=1402135 RepID=UPI001AF07141|nr:lysine/arginine/ornithine ABC transporter substrate-binding protein [Pseudosulfitobacter pseudonitzschiae]MBM1816704.1 transporter substrate-binding domain-containing protein [Pseudosulfitobacter pseudonitzschiae]MBM1833514.1 transporter substrate-binding domain-containing protein [Pseudosulfitobacter pseudonitzschiae]MBM1838381.1 transporter substrate-binding domain-containing protein [Pseudosulfitobacter pseudonitzschiae]MBM1843431.1 transporter substrate-binding domain-containing protein 
MKTSFAAALSGAIAALTFAFSAAAQDLPDALVIGTEGAYPPFNFTESDGNVAGFEIDLGNAMCAHIKVECTWVTQDWDGIIPGLQAKKYDAIIASLYITDERRKVIAFSDKYYNVPSRFVVATDSTLDISADGLSGAIVGTQRATSFERYLTAEMPDVEVRLYGTMDEAYLDLGSGRVDAVLGDVVALQDGFLGTPEGAGFELRGPEFTNPEYFGYGAGVAVRQDDQAIADAFSEAIRALRENGTYQEISQKWFGLDVYGN